MSRIEIAKLSDGTYLTYPGLHDFKSFNEMVDFLRKVFNEVEQLAAQ